MIDHEPTPRAATDASRRALTAGVTLLACLVPLLAAAVGFLVYRSVDQSQRVTENVHNFTQANVQARYDDCQASNVLRAALRTRVLEGKRTDPLLFKLVPSLDTPEVHAIIKAQRQRQLRAFAAKDCVEFALEAVPSGQRHNYIVRR